MFHWLLGASEALVGSEPWTSEGAAAVVAVSASTHVDHPGTVWLRPYPPGVKVPIWPFRRRIPLQHSIEPLRSDNRLRAGEGAIDCGVDWLHLKNHVVVVGVSPSADPAHDWQLVAPVVHAFSARHRRTGFVMDLEPRSYHNDLSGADSGCGDLRPGTGPRRYFIGRIGRDIERANRWHGEVSKRRLLRYLDRIGRLRGLVKWGYFLPEDVTWTRDLGRPDEGGPCRHNDAATWCANPQDVIPTPVY